ncbi:MAG: hypothetical protein HUJ59_00175 [Bacilli bacterium]|nr:hypothetical protein [Bacilli bacterium]
MPHSGGGGSSGGGYHGGSSSGTSSGQRISNKPFKGSHRYVYYYHSRAYYYYSDKPAITKKSDLIYILFFGLLFIVGSVFLIIRSFFTPTKIKNTEIYANYIFDNAEVIEDEDRLLNTLNEFKDITGVPVTIATFYNDDWIGSFEDYLYDYYVDKYNDEYHLVVGYSVNKDNSNDWYFETMFGDDTGKVIGSDREEIFSKSIYNQLAKDGLSFETAIKTEIDSAKEYVMVPYTIYGTLVAGIIIGSITTGALTYYLLTFKKRLKRNGAYEVSESAKEYTCAFCGNKYLASSSLTKCPHCGAATSYCEIEEPNQQ